MRTCLTCRAFKPNKTFGHNPSGWCHCYPNPTKKKAIEFCLQHVLVEDDLENMKRPKLMKALKEAGVRVNIKWSSDRMKEELTNARQAKEASHATGEGKAGDDSG